MRLRPWMIWTAFLLSLAGCGGPQRETAERPQADGSGAAGGDARADGAKLLTIDAEVLRNVKLTTLAAGLRPGGEGVDAAGELKVDESAYAEVGTPIAARVVRLIAGAGDAVRRGQALAELQSAELGRARAQQTAARAQAEVAGRTVERKRGLAAERIVSQGELQRSEADFAQAEAELRAADAAVSALGVGAGPAGGDLSGFALPAPISGTVLERTAVRGQMADPARPLFRIADLRRLWLVVQTPERDAVRVRAGAAAEIWFAALPGRKLQGTVDWIGREVDPHSRTVPVRIVLPNEGGILKPGMFASARLAVGGGEQVVAVPSTAVQRLENQWVVFLPRGTGRFEVRPVERGQDLGSEVAVASGLKPGEQVVDEGAFVLRAEADKQAGGGEADHD